MVIRIEGNEADAEWRRSLTILGVSGGGEFEQLDEGILAPGEVDMGEGFFPSLPVHESSLAPGQAFRERVMHALFSSETRHDRVIN